MTALLTLAQVAETLAMSERQLRDFIKLGMLPFVNIGLGERPAYRFRQSDIDAFADIHCKRRAGEPVHLSDIQSKQFQEAYEALLGGRAPIGTISIPDEDPSRRRQQVRASLKASMNRAVVRAGKKGVPFSLTMDWAVETAERQNFRCSLTGIPFYTEHGTGSHAHPYAPSFDRITPRLGYVAENVRLVVVAINAAIGDWGIEVFEQIALGYAAKRGRQ